MSRISVISETYSGHGDNYTEVDEKMIRKWNSVVTPQDHVYYLGDAHVGGDWKYLDSILGATFRSTKVPSSYHSILTAAQEGRKNG